MEELYKQAIELIKAHRICNPQFLIRQLGVDYNQAIKIIDRLELDGIVGEFKGNQPREIKI